MPKQKIKMKIYIITCGEYSDSHICAVCSNKEKAEEAKNLYGYDSKIEEYEIDKLPDHPKGEYLWEVKMDWDGNVAHDPQTLSVEYYGNKKFSIDWCPYSDSKIRFDVWAKTDKGAIKSCNEKRIQLISNGYHNITWKRFTELKEAKLLIY